jgi:bis(5'-nucleosyl)-tetraphosphatase (symmetrical)
VHAGLSPDWNVEEAVSWARRVERGLATPGRDEELLRRADHGADVEDSEWQALATFTRMRTLTSDGRFGGHTGRLDEVPAGQRPWFEVAHRRGDELTVVAGHWAALGLYLGTEVLALDTGAAWGSPLTAIRLEDRRVVQQANRDIR